MAHIIRKLWEKKVADGSSGIQAAIPNGKFIGDVFFVTDVNNKIIIGLVWLGNRWATDYEMFDVQDST